MNISSISLPKWPALIVHGKPVTPDQAIEILFRTNDRWWSTNDREFINDLKAIFADDLDTRFDSHFLNLKHGVYDEKWGNLNLEYLANSRICSSWIGGTHGWCDWNGQIFSNNYNIGKWPQAEEVLAEWEAIAKAFPYLSLRSQLLNGETCEENPVALVEFVVENGEVEWYQPTETMPVVDDITTHDMVSAIFDGRKREHISIEHFEKLYNRFLAIRGYNN